MNNDIIFKDLIKDFKKSFDLKKDSKLSLYCNDDDLDFIFEIKNLNKLSVKLFLLIILDKLIQQNFIDKEQLLNMINEIL